MTTIRRVLLPTDLSDLSAHAARFARSVARAYSATLYVLHVREPLPTAAPAPDLGTGMMSLTPGDKESRAALDAFVRKHFEVLPSSIEIDIRNGSAAGAIADYAREMSIDLIVIGTHARGLLNRIFLGSVSKAVLENAPCAVLMVPLKAPVPEPSPVDILANAKQAGAH